MAKNEVLKENIKKDEKRIDNEYEAIEERQFPCPEHLEPSCEICYYNDEEMTELGQHTQKTHTNAASDVQNNFEETPSTESTHDISIESL